MMDLARALPLLLPRAVAWAEAESAAALESGVALSPEAREIARSAGVAAPEKIRIRIAETLPVPDDPELRAAATQAGLLGPDMIGLTLGYAIFLRAGHLNTRVLSHECRHVFQYESHGGIGAFLPVYLAQVVAVGHAPAPFERDARDHEVMG